MKSLVGLIYFIGILFWSSLLAVALFNFVSLNGINNLFPFDDPEIVHVNVEEDSADVNINYRYKVEFEDHYKIAKKFFYDKYSNLDTIIIKQNKIFPKVSYIEGIPLKLRQAKVSIIISLFFLLFIIALWNFGNKDKWIKRYETNRPWLYPEDMSIKNPWRRFISRLFKNET